MFPCRACGTQFPDSGDTPPRECPICEDERQYIPLHGQQWTTLEELRSSHQADIRECEPRLTGVGMKPHFAIGQRALLVESTSGNVLWDCLPMLEAHEELVRERGGLSLIAIAILRTRVQPSAAWIALAGVLVLAAPSLRTVVFGTSYQRARPRISCRRPCRCRVTDAVRSSSTRAATKAVPRYGA